MTTTLLDALKDAATSRRGHAYFDGAASEVVGYERLADEALQTARRLLALGIESGERIALASSEPRAFVRTFLGSMMAGIVPVPVAPPAGAQSAAQIERLVAIIGASDSHHLIGDERSALGLKALASALPGLRITTTERLEQSEARASLPSGSPSGQDVAFLQFTSGSTSAPKGVVLTHECLLANARAIGLHGIRFDANEDVAVSWLPLHHDMGLIGFVVTPMVASVQAVFLATHLFLRRPGLWFDAIQGHEGTITFAPNFALALTARWLEKRSRREWDLRSLRAVGCGAEPVDASTLERFAELVTRLGGMPETALLPSYGMAEATLAMTFGEPDARYRVDRVDASVFSESGFASPPATPTATVRRVVSCGRPLHGHELRVLREDGTPAPERHEGEIVFRGPSVAPGYFRDEKSTRTTFRDGWLHTGDLGYLAAGEVYVTGRKKDLIICSGVKHHAADVEQLALAVPGLRAGGAAAFSVPGSETEQIVLVVECASAAADSVVAAVASHVRRELDVPVKEVLAVRPGALPRTSSGKLRREAVRTWYLGRAAAREGRGES